jgi:hypothetical protein
MIARIAAGLGTFLIRVLLAMAIACGVGIIVVWMCL